MRSDDVSENFEIQLLFARTDPFHFLLCYNMESSNLS